MCAVLATLVALLQSGASLSLLAQWWPWPERDASEGLSHMDKLAHAGMFAICGYSLVLGWLTRGAQILPIYLGLLAMGVSTEWLQADIPGRSTDAWDLVADAVGATLGVAAGWHRLRRHLTL